MSWLKKLIGDGNVKFSEIQSLQDYKEYIRENSKKYYEANKEKKKAYKREYYKKNREKILASKKEKREIEEVN